MPQAFYPRAALAYTPPYAREVWAAEGRYVPVDYAPGDRMGPPLSGVYYGPYGPMPAPTGPMGQVPATQTNSNTLLWLLVLGLVAYMLWQATRD